MLQLNIFEQIRVDEVRVKLQKIENEKKSEPYRNLKGELLPWEEPEYLDQLTNTP